MKKYFTLVLVLISTACWAQTDSVVRQASLKLPYSPHMITASLSIGFIDAYKQSYTLPAGFQKNNTSGFTPVYAKLDYGLGENFSMALAVGYDAFTYNFYQDYTGNNGPFTRYKADEFRLFSVGLTAFYHLGKVIRVNRLDPFVGAGLSINNIRYSAYPQGDSLATIIKHSVTPYLKVGARYYISDKFSLFGDLGYDKQSILSLGFSCRFFTKK